MNLNKQLFPEIGRTRMTFPVPFSILFEVHITCKTRVCYANKQVSPSVEGAVIVLGQFLLCRLLQTVLISFVPESSA
jgi:hypothetical protein